MSPPNCGQALAGRTVILLSHVAPSSLHLFSALTLKVLPRLLPLPAGGVLVGAGGKGKETLGRWAVGRVGSCPGGSLSRDLGLAGDERVPVERGMGGQNLGEQVREEEPVPVTVEETVPWEPEGRGRD